ncbi:DNA replication protein psf1 [Lunasporangiospora selenospora]|uniref:DNA replication complex GINS protein PSF1 n=1 Tax=Lunasporangiospora selenospora TaxID=979761 RepID=A0A9P6G209_9FUNG|nr:DNA replication protein psf1 [Lunasporangiospora selenospora]
MYGEEASKLARETKRTVDHFPPNNDPLVRSITREIRHLHETCQNLIREYTIQKQEVDSEIERQWQLTQTGAESESRTGARSGSSSTSRAEAGAGMESLLSSDPNYTTIEMLEPLSSSSNSSNATRVPSLSPAVAIAVAAALSSPSTSQTNARSSIPLSNSVSRTNLQALKQRALDPLSKVFWTKYHVHYTPLQRNKRILMAYHHQRLEKIKELSWTLNTFPIADSTLGNASGSSYTNSNAQTRTSASSGPPTSNSSSLPSPSSTTNWSTLLSPDELSFVQEYERIRNQYTNSAQLSEIDLAGIGMITPPKEVFITVRVLRDCGDIVTESGAVLSLKRNSEHFVKRGDVERLIAQGYLLHVG